MLKEQGLEPNVAQDPDALKIIREKDKDETPNVGENRGLYKSRGDFLYLEFPDETDLAPVYPTLEKYGYVPPAPPEAAAALESAEYHCLYCDYTSDHPGQCPTHQARLLEFSEWLEAQHKSGQLGARGKMYFLVFAAVAVAIFMVLRSYKLF